MRFPTALGGFLAICGLVILLLRPRYDAGGPIQPAGVEATLPTVEYRQIPQWVGAASALTGLALLAASWLTAKRR